MQKLGREELKVELQKHTCIKARKWALEKIWGSVVLEFNRLFDYVFALRSVDPNGTFELMVERPTEVEKPKFKRLYVCFSALKEGFKRFCRLVISLDGCYLKGSFKGEILSVVGRDGNNQIFPIAWALVEVENKDTWTWAYLKRFINAYQMWSTDFVLGICMPIGRNCTEDMRSCVIKTFVVDIRNWTCTCRSGRPSQVLLSRPHISSNRMASTTSQPIISQSHSTYSHPTTTSSRQSTTISKPQGERRPKLPTMKRTNAIRRP
ncbi:hypothetical protein V6N13_038139 [Hibiscus sabdariffa]